MQAVYNGATYFISSIIDAPAGATLMNKAEDEAYSVIKRTVLSNYQWSNGRTLSKKAGGKCDVDALMLLTAIMHAIAQRL